MGTCRAVRPRARRALLVGLAAALVVMPAGQTTAHRLGKPVPVVRLLTEPTSSVTWHVSVRLVDDDSRQPIRKAAVRVTPAMDEPHRMILPAVPLEESPYVQGLYSGPVSFPHPARWTLSVEVAGEVIPVRKSFQVDVPAPGARGGSESAPAAALSTTANIRLTTGEWLDLAVLSFHMVVGALWTLSLVLAAAGRIAVDRGGMSAPPNAGLRRFVVWSWAAVAIMTVSGIYNAVYNMPVTVDWLSAGPAEHLAAFDRVPFGTIYAGLLAAKHIVIVALLASLVALTATARQPAAASGPRLRVLLWLSAMLGVLILLQSGALGYFHRLIAHF